MHRISLRGPWNLAVNEDRLEASRKFHAPGGFSEEPIGKGSADALEENHESLCFLWQAITDWPTDRLRFNDVSIFRETPRLTSELEQKYFSWDSEAGVGRTRLNGILRPFNEMVLVWQRWPAEWEALTGRYTPATSHPIHFDSWLEIQS
jgi:hypothetical protein